MADYYSLLARAISALPQATPEMRKSVYERARKALFNQLRGIQPPVAESDIEAEGRALEAAVQRLEGELAAKAAEASAGPAPIAAPPAPVSAPANAPPPPPPPAQKAPPPAAAPQKPQAAKAAPAPAAAKVQKPADKAPAPPPQKSGPSPLDILRRAPAAEPKDTKGEAGGWRASLGRLVQREGDAPAGEAKSPMPPKPLSAPSAAAPTPAATAAPSPAAPAKPKTETENGSVRDQPQRPAAPTVASAETLGGSRRVLAIGGVVALLIAAVAFAAVQLREKPEDLAKLKAEDGTAAETVEGGKIAERVGEGESGRSGAAPSNAATLPVAQKAELWVASLNEPTKVDKVLSGNVVWRLENIGGGPGEPVGSAVRGDVDVPDAKLKLTLLFQKNYDSTLSASHTIKVTFKFAAGSDIKGVKMIAPLQMRRPDAQVGEKIQGVPVPITENNFLIGLMRGDRESRNIYLMRSDMVIDLPMQLTDGRAATINIEKGATGDRVFASAIDAWGK